MTDRGWVSLFSCGKDSSYAYYLATERGLPVDRLITVHPDPDSYLYHVPATELAPLVAESIGLPLLEIEPSNPTEQHHDSQIRGDRELEPLERELTTLNSETAVAGVTVGAVASNYQADRIEGVCNRLGLSLFAPLWHREESALLADMLDAGFEITIIQVAAEGFDESWLGRTIDESTVADLTDLRDQFGINLIGEGGEYETLVTDGPHMSQPLRFEATPQWDGTRGTLHIDSAWLE